MFQFWLVIIALLFSIIFVMDAKEKKKKKGKNKTPTIAYDVTAATLLLIMIVIAVVQFGYQSGSDKAKRDNRNDGVTTESNPS